MLVTLSLSSLLLCVAATILFYVGIIGKQPQSLQKKAICCLAVSFLLLSLLLCVNFIRDMNIFVAFMVFNSALLVSFAYFVSGVL